MTLAPVPLTVLLGVGAVMTALLAFAFLRSPAKGMVQATHRPESLPLVMIDRYLGLAIIQLGLIFFGSLEMIAVFCVAGAVMGFGDSLIYARSGHTHLKHTMSGCLAMIGLAVTLYYLLGGAA